MALSNYKSVTKTLPNGDLYFKGAVDQGLVFLYKNEGFDKVPKLKLRPRYLFFGEYILTIIIGKK